MCLRKKNLYPKKSAKPIKVYKILDKTKKGWVTPYQRAKVNLGDVIKARVPYSKGLLPERNVDGEGVHAFTTIEAALRKPPFCFYDYDCFSECYAIFEAIIPSETPYWEGLDDDIASTEMTLTSKKVELDAETRRRVLQGESYKDAIKS